MQDRSLARNSWEALCKHSEHPGKAGGQEWVRCDTTRVWYIFHFPFILLTFYLVRISALLSFWFCDVIPDSTAMFYISPYIHEYLIGESSTGRQAKNTFVCRKQDTAIIAGQGYQRSNHIGILANCRQLPLLIHWIYNSSLSLNFLNSTLKLSDHTIVKHVLYL